MRLKPCGLKSPGIKLKPCGITDGGLKSCGMRLGWLALKALKSSRHKVPNLTHELLLKVCGWFECLNKYLNLNLNIWIFSLLQKILIIIRL